MGSSLEVLVLRNGPTARVSVAGELDIATAPQLLHRVGPDGTLDDSASILLDLTAVTFIDSSGLRALLDAYAAVGDRLRVVPGSACRRLLELVGMTDGLPLVQTEQRA
jgi:anti-sigma B factor antagonist